MSFLYLKQYVCRFSAALKLQTTALDPDYALFSSVVEWLRRRTRDQHGLGSKPTRAILLCPWERYFTAHSPVWWYGKQF